ncbi:MAG: STAS domain-containing protein [Bacteroidales bacterium]|nr:STAS domain-containing protein [Bacteroidales bacterium]
MLEVNKVENKYVVSFYNMNKLNVLNSNEIETKLFNLINQEGSSLALNFSGIKFIDSSGFDMLLKIYRVAKENNSELRFINLSEDLMELMRLVELETVFQLN